jgi:phosphoribosylformylglycinamidine synthase
VADGGLLVALAEMALASGIGAVLEAPPITAQSAAHAFWFGEDQGRYVVTADTAAAARVLERANAAGVPVCKLGTTGGDALTVVGERPILVAKLRESFEGWLPAFMAGGAA